MGRVTARRILERSVILDNCKDWKVGAREVRMDGAPRVLGWAEAIGNGTEQIVR